MYELVWQLVAGAFFAVLFGLAYLVIAELTKLAIDCVQRIIGFFTDRILDKIVGG